MVKKKNLLGLHPLGVPSPSCLWSEEQVRWCGGCCYRNRRTHQPQADLKLTSAYLGQQSLRSSLKLPWDGFFFVRGECCPLQKVPITSVMEGYSHFAAAGCHERTKPLNGWVCRAARSVNIFHLTSWWHVMLEDSGSPKRPQTSPLGHLFMGTERPVYSHCVAHLEGYNQGLLFLHLLSKPDVKSLCEHLPIWLCAWHLLDGFWSSMTPVCSAIMEIFSFPIQGEADKRDKLPLAIFKL